MTPNWHCLGKTPRRGLCGKRHVEYTPQREVMLMSLVMNQTVSIHTSASASFHDHQNEFRVRNSSEKNVSTRWRLFMPGN